MYQFSNVFMADFYVSSAEHVCRGGGRGGGGGWG